MDDLKDDFQDDGDEDFVDPGDDFGDDEDVAFEDVDVDDEFADGDEDWDAGGTTNDWDDDIQDMNTDQAIFQGVTSETVKTAIPELTVHDINSNVDEINMLPMFAAASDLKSRSRIGAIVAIKVDRLTNITQDQLEVWGLSPEYPYIALIFEFGVGYLYELQPPKMRVGICKRLAADADLKAFRLSWTINERCSNTLLNTKNWPCDIQEKQIKIPDAHKIADLMESTQQEYSLLLEALNMCHGNTDEVVNMMFDPAQVKKIKKKLPSTEECNVEFRDIMGKISTKSDQDIAAKTKVFKVKQDWLDEYKNADLASQIQQVSDMFNMPFSAAALIVQEVGYDTAINQLQDKSVLDNYLQRAKSNDPALNKVHDFLGAGTKRDSKKNVFGRVWNKVKGNSNSNSNNEDDAKAGINDLEMLDDMLVRSSSGGKIRQMKSEHVLRSIVVMSRHNFLLRVLCFALKVLLNGNKYCMICDKELAFAGLKPTICSAPFCQFRHDQIGLGFSLAAEVINRPDIIDLLVTMTYSASNSGRIHFFFPSGVRGLDNDTAQESFLVGDIQNFDAEKFALKEPGQPTPDIAKLKTVINICPAINDMKPWADKGDVFLKKKLTELHCLLYPLLVWIVTSNRSHLRKLPEEQRIKCFDTEYQFALCSQTPEKEAQFQELQEQNGSFLAFHGSPMGNWHSILRMGLRNYSKTKHQTNGAAYGNGIYFGKNFSLAWSYCRPGQNPGWTKSIFGTSTSCMALCEICYHSGDAHHHVSKKINSATGGTENPTGSSFGKRQVDKKNRWAKTTQIYVVDLDECVSTRFFIIFPKTSGYKQIQASSVKIPSVVNRFK